NDEIPAGATETLLSLTAKEGAKPTQGVIPQVIGESGDPKTPLRRVAIAADPPPPAQPNPLTRSMPWLRQELAIAIAEPGPLGIVLESLDERLPIGGNARAKVKVSRAAEAKGTVRLTLV